MSNTAVSDQVYQTPHRGANAEIVDMSGTLNREYITDYFWSTVDAQDTIVFTLNFPDDLFSKAFIADMIAKFGYFRAGVRVSIRVASNRYLYGKLLVYANPNDNTDPAVDATTVQEMANFPHVLVSASASEAVVFDLPFIHWKRFININSYGVGEMWTVKAAVLNPLTSIDGSANTANVLVSYQFIDSEMFLPESNPQEARLKSSLGTEANNLIKSSIRPASMRAFQKISRSYTSLKYNMINAAVSSIPYMLGLSKPTLLSRNQIMKLNPFHDTASGKGVDSVVKLSMDPENAISVQPCVGGLTEDEMKLSYIMGTPSLTDVIEVHRSTMTFTVALATVQNSVNTYVDTMLRCFRYWSGSFKIKIYITASIFHNVRLYFWLTNTGVTKEQCYHKVVEVTGDTEVEFTLPYIQQGIASNSSTTSGYSLMCDVVSFNEPEPVLATPIFLNVYRAAASDMQVGALMEVELESNPRADFKKDFPFFHDTQTLYEHDGFIWGEKYTSLREIMSRYHAVAQSTTSVAVWAGTRSLGVEKWGRFFRFQRGSMRYKMITKPGTNATRVAYLANDAVRSLHGFTLSMTNNPVIDVECPYYRQDLYGETLSNSSRKLYVTTSMTNPVWLTNSVGDDFSMHFLRLVPTTVTVIDPDDTTQGQGGLLAWCEV